MVGLVELEGGAQRDNHILDLHLLQAAVFCLNIITFVSDITLTRFIFILCLRFTAVYMRAYVQLIYATCDCTAVLLGQDTLLKQIFFMIKYE